MVYYFEPCVGDLLPWCCSLASEVVSALSEYLRSDLPMDMEGVRRGAPRLRHLHRTLGTACQGLHRYISTCLHAPVNFNVCIIV